MIRVSMLRNERGIALMTVLLVGFALSTIAFTGAIWLLNAQMLRKNGERAAILNDAAVAGLEEGRSRLSATPSLYPTTGYATLDNGVSVRDASNAIIPGLRRWVYAGPNGINTGQYGVFGTIISVVRDTVGNKAVRRLQIAQESFAKYAYFTTIEGDIVFANNDQIRGPVHSNDQIKIASSGATFFDQVTTAYSSIQGESNGDFRGPSPRKNVPTIPLPTTQAFSSLQGRASAASMSFTSSTVGASPGVASMRMEFVAIDLNADGDSTDADEGFVRIYENNSGATAAALVTAHASDVLTSENCGVPVLNVGGGYTLTPPNGLSARFTTVKGKSSSKASDMLVQGRCYLGGDPRLYQDSFPTIRKANWLAAQGTWSTNRVGWIPRPGSMGAPTVAAFTNRLDAAYLWPINRTYNPAWQGVIYVNGRVAVSGVINGRVTLASPENIVIADDIRMAVDPGGPNAADCENILGLFSGKDVLVADNTINTGHYIKSAYRTLDDTRDEEIHAIVLALGIFGAERYDSGPDEGQSCGTSKSGRGCLALTGGIIQRTRGAVGLTSGEGYIKRYAYNSCAVSDPPPYFPTTGRFVRNRVYEIDPMSFDVANWFATQQNN